MTVQATKENARQAIATLDALWRRTDLTREDIKFLDDFLRATEKRLPSEASIEVATQPNSKIPRDLRLQMKGWSRKAQLSAYKDWKASGGEDNNVLGFSRFLGRYS
jgi:hypothetical protein